MSNKTQYTKSRLDKTISSTELYLWQRYYFNRDMGDVNRANYWANRIKEYKEDINHNNKKNK